MGLYATLVNINAYHQPGVEAGKKAAATVLDLQAKFVAALTDEPQTLEKIAESAGVPDGIESILLIADHLAANKRIVKKGNTYAKA